MKRYNLVNLPEDCKIVPDSYGDWMRVAEHEVLTVKYRDALEKIAANDIYCLETDSNGMDGCDLSRKSAKEALAVCDAGARLECVTGGMLQQGGHTNQK